MCAVLSDLQFHHNRRERLKIDISNQLVEVNQLFTDRSVGFNKTTLNVIKEGQSLESEDFVTGTTGWRILGNGDVEFNTGTFRGDLIAGAIHIPDEDTTANSFHVDSTGNSWWGATQSSFTSDVDNAIAYVLKDGTAKFKTAVSGARVEMVGSNLSCYDASGIRVNLDASNARIDLYDADSTDAFQITGQTTSGTHILEFNDTWGSNVEAQFEMSIKPQTDDTHNLGSSTLGWLRVYTGSVYNGSDAYLNFGDSIDCYKDLIPETNDSQSLGNGTMRFNQLYFTSATVYGNSESAVHKSNDWGANSAAFNTMFADDFTNIADFYWLDHRKTEEGDIVEIDDVQVIQDIQSTGIYDEKTGFLLIDDDTLPLWLLTKQKEQTPEEIEKNPGKVAYPESLDGTARDPDGKPYLSLKTMISLTMGAIRQLDTRLKDVEKKPKNN